MYNNSIFIIYFLVFSYAVKIMVKRQCIFEIFFEATIQKQIDTNRNKRKNKYKNYPVPFKYQLHLKLPQLQISTKKSDPKALLPVTPN